MNNLNYLPPFKRLCVTIGNLPSSYVESMSYYECLMWLCKYLKETVVPAINENAEAVNELINWFNNLNVQDEIDHKLDEMAADGTLAEIIEDYATIPELTERIAGVEDEVDELQLGLIEEEIILIGDSYLAGQSLTNPSTENFGYLLMNKLGMNTTNFHAYGEGGSSFTNPGNGGHTWQTLLQAHVGDVTPSKITKIIFAGGYNDIVANSPSVIDNAMSSCISYAKSTFPNAKIYVSLLGNNAATTNDGANARNLLKNRIYNVYSKCYNYGAIFLDKGQLAIQDYTLYENNTTAVHPNAAGHQAIANLLYQELVYGSCDYRKDNNAFNAVIPDTFQNTGTLILYEKLFNNEVHLKLNCNLVKASGYFNQKTLLLDLGEQSLHFLRYNNVATGRYSHVGFIQIGNSTLNTYDIAVCYTYIGANNHLMLYIENNYGDNANKIITAYTDFVFDVQNV